MCWNYSAVSTAGYRGINPIIHNTAATLPIMQDEIFNKKREGTNTIYWRKYDFRKTKNKLKLFITILIILEFITNKVDICKFTKPIANISE